eukprot:403370394
MQQRDKQEIQPDFEAPHQNVDLTLISDHSTPVFDPPINDKPEQSLQAALQAIIEKRKDTIDGFIQELREDREMLINLRNCNEEVDLINQELYHKHERLNLKVQERYEQVLEGLKDIFS